MSVTTFVIGVGYLGKRFCATADDNVRGLTRADYDLDAGGALPIDLPTDYKVLYTVPPARESSEDVRLTGLLELLDPVPRRFVYISTTGVYGDHRGAEVDEQTPVNPGSPSAALRVAAETALAAWAEGTGCDAVILRVPGIYGPGRLGIERIREQSPIVREEDVGPGNRIHVDDLATCCAAALDDSTPAGIYNVGDGDHRTSAAFTKEVARQLDLPPPPEISMAEAEQQFSPMRLSFLRDQRRVSTAKMASVLGVTPKYPDASYGIAASLD
ncbi:MAG: NAD-dependent epimerase/dehydratase family protein [Woeseiaceae bacterium]|nr:NAD-dependent epimerase/dehydratase family protein [Woeseiaceae bacterium]